MSLRERINDRRQIDVTPLHERRAGERRGMPRWIARKIDRELRGLDGLPVQDRTRDLLEAA